jgi:hypothetical protein
MKKADAEKALRYLMHEWRKDRGFGSVEPNGLSYCSFKSWLSEKHYSAYLNFRTMTSVDYDVEMWFDQEFHRTGN